MFDNKTEDEIDFCESYKSQILNNGTEEKSSSLGTVLKISTILLLLAVIIALSIYGYNYFMHQNSSKNTVPIPPLSIQISDEDLKVIDESSDETQEVQKPMTKEENSNETLETQNPLKEEKVIPIVTEETPSVKKAIGSSSTHESDIDKIANNMKIAIAKAEEKNKNIVEKSTSSNTKKEISEEESLKVPVPHSPEAKYLEDLADLSKEIDREK